MNGYVSATATLNRVAVKQSKLNATNVEASLLTAPLARPWVSALYEARDPLSAGNEQPGVASMTTATGPIRQYDAIAAVRGHYDGV
jgi:hypothetical protein